MSIVILLLPALAWGLLPLAVTKLGGQPLNQIFGTAVGTALASLILLLFQRPQLNLQTALLAALAGGFWIIGQLGQYQGYQKIGVSKTMPISTGLQLAGTALIGVILFGEWPTPTAKIIGALGILILIIGVILTAVRSTNAKNKQQGQRQTIIMLVLTTFGYLIYNTIPRALSSSGLNIFLPESIGMLLTVLIYTLITRQPKILAEKASWANVIGGLIFSVAAITYILSVRLHGVNTAFIISQLSVVISTLGGIALLGEHKARLEVITTLSGLCLIVFGAIITTIF
ncbi:GRP family sugar transporter [Lactiplantibacillus herbarum]|uniref:GRP family sugar transporter n=1 Tax=Lactiplantibacillus herbarum TaxID=1670446 RepID=UPI00064FD91C|nr:GRP family sugar transporter [Lactiplantibacillus herbarum]